jgi:quercetin dioxygenase-like cupin family protein
MAGGATLITGGTIVDATVSGPGEHRGPAIRGGSELAIAAGDVLTIRPGVPHWVKAVDGRLRYMVVKVHASSTPRSSSE